MTLEPPSIKELKQLFDKNADIVAVGLQEVKSQPVNYAADSIYEDSWTSSLRYCKFKLNLIIHNQIISLTFIGMF